MSTMKTESTDHTEARPSTVRLVVIGTLVAAAFFASYTFANARSGRSTAVAGAAVSAPGQTTAPVAGTAPSTSGSGSGFACACGGGTSTASAKPVGASTTVAGGVQTIAVDTSSGSYNPNVINAKAGVPLRITFSQSSGCLGQVQFPDFKIIEDLTSGPKTIELPALKAGTYSFACGMNMVFGKIVVE